MRTLLFIVLLGACTAGTASKADQPSQRNLIPVTTMGEWRRTEVEAWCTRLDECYPDISNKENVDTCVAGLMERFCERVNCNRLYFGDPRGPEMQHCVLELLMGPCDGLGTYEPANC